MITLKNLGVKDAFRMDYETLHLNKHERLLKISTNVSA
jgi:hypothetical protein